MNFILLEIQHEKESGMSKLIVAPPQAKSQAKARRDFKNL